MSETQKAFEKAGFTAQKIAEELALIAFADPADIMDIDEGGAIIAKTFEQMGDKRRVIKTIKEKTTIKESSDGSTIFKNSQVEYEPYSKLEALKFGASGAGVSVEKKELSGSVTVNHDLSPEVQDVFDKIYVKAKHDKKRRAPKL